MGDDNKNMCVCVAPGSVQYVAVHSLPGQHGSGGLQQQAFISQAALQAQHVAASSVGHVTQNMVSWCVLFVAR